MTLSTRDLIITDLENELRQLQNEWSAVTEYCAELQSQQHNIHQDIAAAQLEEKLVTKKLRELLGESEPATNDDGYFFDETNDKSHAVRSAAEAEREMLQPWRVLNVEEKERVMQLVFGEDHNHDQSTMTLSAAEQEAAAAATDFILGIDDEAPASERDASCLNFVSSADQQKQQQKQQNASLFAGGTTREHTLLQRHPLRSSQSVNLSSTIRALSARLEQSQNVAVVLQKQKEALTARLHQGGAVSVALDAILLFKQPVM